MTEAETPIEGRFVIDPGYYSLALIIYRSLKAAEREIEAERRLPFLATKAEFFGKLIEKGVESFAASDPDIIPILAAIMDYEEQVNEGSGIE